MRLSLCASWSRATLAFLVLLLPNEIELQIAPHYKVLLASVLAIEAPGRESGPMQLKATWAQPTS